MKIRFISALILLIVALPLIYFGGFYFNIAVGIISVLAYKEITNLPCFKNIPILIKLFGVIFYLAIVYGNLMNGNNGSISYLYLILLYIFYLIPTVTFIDSDYKIKDASYLTSKLIFVGLCFASLISARESLEIFVYLLSITVFSDTFAYITGKLIGKNKLCPTISPNKTIEGSIGGLLLGSMIPLIIYQYIIGDITIVVIIMTIVLAIFSQIGDLIFSKIKRENDIKDFSNIIPGHGGILDRFDSILFVSIIYLVFCSIL